MQIRTLATTLIVLLVILIYFGFNMINPPNYSLEGDCDCQENEAKILAEGGKVTLVKEHKSQGPDDFSGFKVTYTSNKGEIKTITHYNGGITGKGQHTLE